MVIASIVARSPSSENDSKEEEDYAADYANHFGTGLRCSHTHLLFMESFTLHTRKLRKRRARTRDLDALHTLNLVLLLAATFRETGRLDRLCPEGWSCFQRLNC